MAPALRPLLALLLLAAALLSGCAGKDPAPADAADGLPSNGDEQAVPDLTAESAVDAPDWAVGQWWTYQARFSNGDGPLLKSIVVESSSNGALLASDDDVYAKDEAAFGTPLLGAIGADLSMNGWGGDWDLLDFPLRDGASWAGSMPNFAYDVVDSDRVDLQMTAQFLPSVDGVAGGQPGYFIMGHVAEGAMALEATYVPALGWFSQLTLYDIDPQQDPLEIALDLTATGQNWTGTYYRHTAEQLVVLFDGNGFTDDPTAGGQPFAEPNPQAAFTVSAQATGVYGYLVAVAVVGAREIMLVPPQGEPYRVEATAIGLEESEVGLFLDEDAVAGEWRVVTAGAGGFSGGFANLFEIVGGEFTL